MMIMQYNTSVTYWNQLNEGAISGLLIWERYENYFSIPNLEFLTEKGNSSIIFILTNVVSK